MLLVALIFGGAVLLAVSAWHLRRGNHVELFRSSAKLGLFVLTIATVLQFPIGGRLGINETNYQPMKIAAAEANWDTCQPCSFSVIQIGGYNQDETPTKIIEIPHLLSILATGTWDGEVQGLSRAEHPVQPGIRPRLLRAECVHPVLVDAGDGLPRHAGRFLVGLWGDVPAVAQEVRDLQVLPLGVHLDGPDAVR